MPALVIKWLWGEGQQTQPKQPWGRWFKQNKKIGSRPEKTKGCWGEDHKIPWSLTQLKLYPPAVEMALNPKPETLNPKPETRNPKP